VVVNYSLPWEFYFAVRLWLYGQESLLNKFLPSAFSEYTKHYEDARFEILTEVLLKPQVIWDITLCQCASG